MSGSLTSGAGPCGTAGTFASTAFKRAMVSSASTPPANRAVRSKSRVCRAESFRTVSPPQGLSELPHARGAARHAAMGLSAA